MKNHPAFHAGRFLLYFLSIGVAVASMRYWSFETVGFLNMKSGEVLENHLFRLFFYGHVIFGPITLLTGPFQFSPRLRKRNLRAHRLSGKVYVVACLVSGLAGFGAAQFTPGGWATQAGFSGLALGWLFTTFAAWQAIRRKDIEAHRRWMIRSFSLTLAAVTLRLYLPLLEGPGGLDFIGSYRIVSWLCWVPNLLAAEWWIHVHFKKPALAR